MQKKMIQGENCIKIFVFLQVVYKVNKSMFYNIKTRPKNRAPEALPAARQSSHHELLRSINKRYNINKQ